MNNLETQMIWMAVYTKIDHEGNVLVRQIGNFFGGNCREVIGKVCKIHSLRVPKEYNSECSLEILVKIPDHPEQFETHYIEVGPVECLIDLQ